MATYRKSTEFIEIAQQCNYNVQAMLQEIRKTTPKATKRQVIQRLATSRRRGLVPLDSGNTVSLGETLKATSTLYDDEGNIVLQWVKSDASKEDQLTAVEDSIKNLASTIEPISQNPTIPVQSDDQTTTVYISNDLHFGMLSWDSETGKDWDIDIAKAEVNKATNYLVDAAPPSKYAVVVDLGDITESDSTQNTTAKSGNALDTDSRLPKVLRIAYQALINLINKALTKHEIVYFYNIIGNHSFIMSTAVREVILQYYRNEPRVIVDSTANPIKYHAFGQCLLQFAHGDSMKMKDAGEVMTVDNETTFSNSKYRYALFG